MKYPLFAILFTLSLTACAQSEPVGTGNAGASESGKAVSDKPADGSKEAMVRATLKDIDPQVVPDRIAPAPIPGFQEAIVSGQVVYISDDGHYMLQGSLYDIRAKKDLSQIGLSVLRREALSKVPATDRIVFAPVGARKHTVSVFTDIDCGYCRKLHSEIAGYNKLGIAVEYLALPRAGLGSPDALTMASIWCSSDRRKALTDAKNGRPVPPKQCDNPVAVQFGMAQSLGISATPVIVSSDGTMIPGYMPPEKLLETLDKRVAEVGTAAGSR